MPIWKYIARHVEYKKLKAEKLMKKVGIVIINFNSMNCLDITMKSIIQAKTDVSFEVGIIDNGSSEKERNACESMVKSLQEQNLAFDVKFFDAGKNLGFSGGNNVVIKYFMEKQDITHICLLNSDVIVTDYWLDYLLEKDCDVIGPVTNAAGNEQTIQVDYSVEVDESAIVLANTYAQKRHESYKGYVVDSELVTFFGTIFKREVIEQIGLLDEQFYPGSYEDDDYCVRILNAGFSINIARDCFLHHYGSGSFSKLKMTERKNIGDINRERFEKKWNRKWQDRTWKLLESCKQDMDYLLAQKNNWEKVQLDSSLVQLEKLIEDWGAAIQYFTSLPDNAQTPESIITNYTTKQLFEMLCKKVKNGVNRRIEQNKKKRISVTQKRENIKATKEGMDKVYEMLELAKKRGHKGICVFAPMYNKENEKDGYVQRIKAIDTTVLKDMFRIYLYDEGVDCMAMRFDYIDDLHAYIVFNSHNQKDLQNILELVKACGKTYTHSILRFIEDRTSRELWKIFDLPEVEHVWDMHGTVPEEYKLSGSELGGELANNIEAVMAEKVDVVVVVTEAMGRYFKNKYPNAKAKIVVVPIFNKELLEPVETNKNPLKEGITIVYAGGTQPWQNIGLMQDVVCETSNIYKYKMFVPNVEEFWQLWGNRRKNADIVVESKTPEDLYKEYTKCDFGFVLRDESPVNYVACPTKIIEYLKFGIIPVLKSIEIGDFVDIGMNYIPYEDLLKGITLNEEKRAEMLEANNAVLSKLMQTYIDGLKNLKDIVEA